MEVERRCWAFDYHSPTVSSPWDQVFGTDNSPPGRAPIDLSAPKLDVQLTCNGKGRRWPDVSRSGF
jgi:hypothetical protein